MSTPHKLYSKLLVNKKKFLLIHIFKDHNDKYKNIQLYKLKLPIITILIQFTTYI